MGGGSSTLSEEQLRQVKRLVEKWANDQDHGTNTALRTQYDRVTNLMSQFNERLTDRQSASEERLERQVRELQQQLEKMQKKVDSNEPGPSGNQINELLNGLANTLKPVLNEKKGKNFDDFPQKTPHMNFSGGPMGSQGFGPVAVNQQSYGGPQFGYQGFHAPNPTGPPSFQQPYHPGQGPMTYQQQFPPGAHPGNSYFPPRFTHPHHPMNAPSQQYPNQNAPVRFSQNQTKNENFKSQKGTEKLTKVYQSTEKAKHQELTSNAPKAQNENKETEKNTGPKVTKKETQKTQKKPQEKIKLEDVEKLIAEFKRQQIEGDQEKPAKPTFKLNLQTNAKQENKNATTPKSDKKSDDAERRGSYNSKRCDKTESGDRREAYKSRGRGRGSHQQWKDKNRQARKKSFNKNINHDESDSDSNESVSSNISCVSKATVTPTNKKKLVFWTTRPNYARNYNMERAKLKLEEATKSLNLANYAKSKPGNKSDSVSQYELESEDENQTEEENVPEKREEKANENKQPSTSRDTNLKVLSYPSEETALREGKDLEKPLEQRMLFIGLTESGEHCTHSPKCLADIYALEKKYTNFQLISLT